MKSRTGSTDKTIRIEKLKAAVRGVHVGNVAGDGNQEFRTWPSTFIKDIMEESLPQGKTRELFTV